MAKGSILLITSGIASTLMAALSGLIIARILGPAKYGLYNLALALPLAFTHLYLFGLDTIFTREVARSPKRMRTMLRTILHPLLPWLILICLVLTGLAWVLGYRLHLVSLVGISTVIVFFRSLANLLRAGFRGLEKFKFDASVMLIDAVVGFALIGGILVFTRIRGNEASVETILLALALAALLSLAVATVLYTRAHTNNSAQFVFDRGFLRLAIASAIPLGITFTIVGLNMRLDVLLLSLFTVEEQVGLYASAFAFVMLSRPVSLLSSASILPKLSKLYLSTQSDFLGVFETGWRYTLITGAFIGVILTMSAPLLVTLFFGEAYIASIDVVRVLGVTTILLFINTYLWHTLIATNHHTQILYSAIASVGATILFSLLLVPVFGVLGMAFATVLRESVQMIWLLLCVTKSTSRQYIQPAIVACIPAIVVLTIVLWPIHNSADLITLFYLPLGFILAFLSLLYTNGIKKSELSTMLSGMSTAVPVSVRKRFTKFQFFTNK